MRRAACAFLLFVLGLATGALAKKPPLEINTPETVRRYWEIDLRIERGTLRFERVRLRHARRGKQILRMAGPFHLLLMGRGGELDRFDFSFPLIGPDQYDARLAAGLTATAQVLVPHRPGLRSFVAQGPKGSPRVERRLPGKRQGSP
jgi:hypothetical protein